MAILRGKQPPIESPEPSPFRCEACRRSGVRVHLVTVGDRTNQWLCEDAADCMRYCRTLPSVGVA